MKPKSSNKKKTQLSSDSEEEEEFSESGGSDEDDFKSSKNKKPKNKTPQSKKKNTSSSTEKAQKTKNTEVEKPAVEPLCEKKNTENVINSEPEKMSSFDAPLPRKLTENINAIKHAQPPSSSKINLSTKFEKSSNFLSTSSNLNKSLNNSLNGSTPLGKIELKNPSPMVRVGLSRNSRVKPLHPNAKPQV
jgi:hypothetical protein